MARLLQNILTSETPVAPAEISDLVQSQEIERRGGGFLESVGFERELDGAAFDVLEEFAVVAGTVGAEVLQDRG